MALRQHPCKLFTRQDVQPIVEIVELSTRTELATEARSQTEQEGMVLQGLCHVREQTRGAGGPEGFFWRDGLHDHPTWT